MTKTTRLYILACVVFVACNTLFFTPGHDLPEVGDWFGEFNIDKLLHSCIFALMSFLFMLPVLLKPGPKKVKIKYFLRVSIAFYIWGMATEFIQKYFIPGRNFSLADMLADALGTIVALVIANLALRIS